MYRLENDFIKGYTRFVCNKILSCPEFWRTFSYVNIGICTAWRITLLRDTQVLCAFRTLRIFWDVQSFGEHFYVNIGICIAWRINLLRETQDWCAFKTLRTFWMVLEPSKILGLENPWIVSATTWENLSLGFSSRSYPNQPPQLQRLARKLKFYL